MFLNVIEGHINPNKAPNEKNYLTILSETIQIYFKRNDLLSNKRKSNQGFLKIEKVNINNKMAKTYYFFNDHHQITLLIPNRCILISLSKKKNFNPPIILSENK